MFKFMNLCMVLCCFILASCGGGGSSADSGSGSGGALSLSDVVGPGPAAGLLGVVDKYAGINGVKVYNSYYAGGYFGYVDLDIEVEVSGGMMIAHDTSGASNDPVQFSPNEFTRFSNGLVGIVFNEYEEWFNDPGIFGTNMEAIILGGSTVDLNYTSFGYWEHRITVEGATINTVAPFVLVSKDARKLQPSASDSFHGVVLASAWHSNLNQRNDNKVVPLVGEADLKMTSINEDVYKLSFM